ncbi:sensor histidine kinase [Terrabacter lapilli]|uniref:Oxygen sensor histidine kinase NreB n=1 Tax=Terrabacter lapilli TaxID=436231 RepID=A0ABN2STB3_9MICO
MVRQAAAAARASELSRDLQRSREAIVLAREEERRRLRRDLHDSLGPSLGAITLRIETARNLMVAHPDRADELLEATTADVAAALADVRRLAHDLRPPALDELGLVAAVQEQARRLSNAALSVEVEADDLGELPAGVEVAAYRIVSEALANVVRHASASRAVVTLACETGAGGSGVLRVEVEDDGRGIAPDATAGVGMLSLRERVGELGGTCEVTCPPGAGTRIRALLPVAPGGGEQHSATEEFTTELTTELVGTEGHGG